MITNSDSLYLPFADGIAQTCVTSPPYYGLRDYGVNGQIGLEQTPAEYIARLVAVFAEVRRVLKDDGTLWLNLGDSYNGSGKGGVFTEASAKQATNKGANISMPMRLDGYKPKDLLMIPARVALALQADGWYLRSEIIWHKPNPMPESVKDRPTKAHEMIYLLAKSQNYFYDYEAVLEPATGYDGRKDTKYKGGKKDMAGGAHERWQYKNLQPDGQQPNTMHLKRQQGEEYMSPVRNRRDVWTVATKPYKGAHFATFPPALIEPCILAGSAAGDIVLDPFNGSGTTGDVAIKNGRKYIGSELNMEYIKLSHERIKNIQMKL